MVEFCNVCGGTNFSSQKVICDKLVNDWEISEEERAYIEIQQGVTCNKCHNNIRTIALAKAIMSAFDYPGLFVDFVKKWKFRRLKVLEINTAGALHEQLKILPKLTFAEYPRHDMNTLCAFADNTFDLVVHSDTLEHITTPIKALAACRRVLKNGKFCIFTIPMIVDRMSRSRAGLPKSYHGFYDEGREDFVVYTEFGADTWEYAIKAGFNEVAIQTLDFPTATVIRAKK